MSDRYMTLLRRAFLIVLASFVLTLCTTSSGAKPFFPIEREGYVYQKNSQLMDDYYTIEGKEHVDSYGVTFTSDVDNAGSQYTTDQSYIEVTTSRSSGMWGFNIDADDDAQGSCWADLNGNGRYDSGEEEGFDFRFNSYRNTIESQTLRIYGDLSRFECSFQQLTAVDLSQAPCLSIFVSNYNKGLADLDFSHNEQLTKIEAYGNGFVNIILGKKPKLKKLDLNENALTSLDLHEAPQLERLDCFGNLIEARQAHDLVISLPVRSEEMPGKLYFINSTKQGQEKNQILVSDVLLAKNKNWEVVDFNASKPYKGIDNTSYTTELPAITFKAQESTGDWKLRLAVLEGEARDSVWLDINGNKLFDFGEELTEGILESGWVAPRETLEVTLYGAVTEINCQENKLSEMDCSANRQLKKIFCNNNKINRLTLGEQPFLMELSCHQNQLEEIDLSQSPNLVRVSLNDNKFSALNFSSNPKLEVLTLSGNQVPSLDLSMQTEIIFLACENNKIVSLDLSKQTKLETLYCKGNKLASLDLSALQALRTLSCEGNTLTSLDFVANKEVESIYCYENAISATQMKSLIVSLPQKEDGASNKLYIVNSGSDKERNSYNEEDLAIAKTKNWQIYDYKGGENSGNNPLSIEDVGDSHGIMPIIANGRLTLSSVAPLTIVKLYAIDGSILRENRTNNEGLLTLDISNLPTGQYLFSIGASTVKVIL